MMHNLPENASESYSPMFEYIENAFQVYSLILEIPQNENIRVRQIKLCIPSIFSAKSKKISDSC